MRRLVLTAVAFLLLSNVADLWFSATTPDYQESNPFARDSQCNFVLKRGIQVKTITDLALLVAAAVLYVGISGVSREVGALAAAGLIFYFAGDAFLNAALPNFLLWLKWYVSCGGAS